MKTSTGNQIDGKWITADDATTTANNYERNFRPTHDFRNDETNERKTIYEVGSFKHYVLIHKKNGEVIAMHHAQNALTLVMKNF